MKRSLIVGPEVEDEIYDAAGWYEHESAGLGAVFLEQLDRKLEAIVENPSQFAIVYRRGTRRALLSRFPYGVFFRERRDGAVRVLAVLHLAREPKQWRRRV